MENKQSITLQEFLNKIRANRSQQPLFNNEKTTEFFENLRKKIAEAKQKNTETKTEE